MPMPYQPRVVIRFADSFSLPQGAEAHSYLGDRLPPIWGQATLKFPWIRLRSESITLRRRKDLPGVSKPIHAIPHDVDLGSHVPLALSRRLARLLTVDTPDEAAARDLVHELRSEPWRGIVERAQVRPRRSPPPKTVKVESDPAAKYQGYQKSAPRGIGARDVWDRLGSSGVGVRVIDVESGWFLEHDQLPSITLVSGLNSDHPEHGVKVLGILAAKDDDEGIVGLCPKASFGVASIVRNANDQNVFCATAIREGAAMLGEGDILLLEIQSKNPETGIDGYPVELQLDVFDAIQDATDDGIIVIEAGGNGEHDLDDLQTDEGYALQRGGQEFKDSGAIMVGACRNSKSKKKHWRYDTSNYGSRIDCYAWGEGVTTLGHPPNELEKLFNETSAASAIVAGAAAIVQGIVRDRHEKDPTWPACLKPAEMRQLLATNGTASQDAAQFPIGLMPDLAAIVQRIIG